MRGGRAGVRSIKVGMVWGRERNVTGGMIRKEKRSGIIFAQQENTRIYIPNSHTSKPSSATLQNSIWTQKHPTAARGKYLTCPRLSYDRLELPTTLQILIIKDSRYTLTYGQPLYGLSRAIRKAPTRSKSFEKTRRSVGRGWFENECPSSLTGVAVLH